MVLKDMVFSTFQALSLNFSPGSPFVSGIGEKVDQQCATLSGGQKRRLWVASALLGDIPVIFLDEPTSGMDPSSRQHLWKLLLEMKSTGSLDCWIGLGAETFSMFKMCFM